MAVMKWELLLSIAVNIVAIAFFAGQMSASQKFMKEAIGELKKGFDEKVKELKEDFNEKVKELKSGFDEKVKELKENFDTKTKESNEHTEKHIKRLEDKQDKYNNIQERTAINEQAWKSAHHRADELRDRIEALEV